MIRINKKMVSKKTRTINTKTEKKIEEKGYKTQVYPRPINLFYLKDNLRERIEKESDIYKVLNTSISF